MRPLRYLTAASFLLMWASTPAVAQDIFDTHRRHQRRILSARLGPSKIFERDLPNSKVSVISTQATVENLNLLQQGKGQLALAQGDIMTDAWKGNPEAGFPSSRTKIRLIGAAYPN
jgi:hypothetical protein